MKVLILFSGGIDSVGLALHALESGFEVYLLHLSYFHPAQDEEAQVSDQAAGQLALRYPDRVTYSNVPHGIKARGMFRVGARYTPMRNLSFLGVASTYAVVYRCQEIWVGATELDQADYADCRPEFFGLFSTILWQQLFDIRVRSPYLDGDCTLTRAEVRESGVSWFSCYEPKFGEACGVCNSCLQ